MTNENGANVNKTYTYDANGNRTGFSLVQDNQTIQQQSYVYDRLNRLTQVTDGNSNVLAVYTYDINNNLKQELKGNGIVTQYTYNRGSQLTRKQNKVNGTIVSDYDYTYYMDGNIMTENDRTFTYDNLGRLKQEQDGEDSISYTYDRFGNRSSMNNSGVVTSYTYDLNNRLLQENSGNKTTFYNYDDRGNLYSKRTDEQSNATDLLRVDVFGELKNNSDSTVELYFYNGLNRLEEVRKGGITAQYQYNAEGIRTSKTVNGVTTDFYLDGANIVAESVNGNTTNYVRGVSGIVYSEIFGSGNSRKYYTSDGHGNITNLINTSGAVVKTYDYDAFGVEENIDSTDTNPFRYCGEYYDSEINQIYLRARYYSPGLGRFTQSDPAMADGYNWYVYCGNNPIFYIDSTGLVSVIFFANNEGTREQAEVRKKAYEDYYNTTCYIVPVSSAYQFVNSWNMWFSDYLAGETIDAIEIISHGSAEAGEPVDGTKDGLSNGFLYFEEDGNNKVNKFYARKIVGMENGDYSIEDLCTVQAKGLNINACNSSNPDLYSVVSGFMRHGNYQYITGWDGSVTWDGEKAVRGYGDYIDNPTSPAEAYWKIKDPWHYVKKHQATFWKNVEKKNGVPIRKRVGKRVIARKPDGDYE